MDGRRPFLSPILGFHEGISEEEAPFTKLGFAAILDGL